MHIDTSVGSAWTASSSAATGRGSPSSASSRDNGWSGYTDTVTISQAARDLYAESVSTGFRIPEPPPSQAEPGPKAAGNAALRRYLDIGMNSGQTNLTAMNFSRKQLSERINNALRVAGIELKGDEKLSISVNAKNEIVVGGIKDKQKARKIQEALNKDNKLATEMRNHVAAGKINENALKQEQYQEYLAANGLTDDADLDEKFTSPAIRNYVINEYLNENAGVGLDDLSLDYDDAGNMAIVGGDERLQALIDQEPDGLLGATIGHILESGETSAEFAVSFEFANGAVSDSHSRDMAKSKIDGINSKLFKLSPIEEDRGVADKLREKLERFGPIDDKALQKALSRGFSIRIKENGDFDIAGLKDLDPSHRQALKTLVQEAMDNWMNDPKGPNAMDGGGQRAANFADVYDAYAEEHRFAHGDTEEHPHELEISFGGGAQAKMVAAEADKEQEAENKELSLQVGEALRSDMAAQGIDTAGMELSIDEQGKITVSGGMARAELEKAQNFVDQFMRDAKADGLLKEEESAGEAKEAKEKDAADGIDAEEEQEEDAAPANLLAWANGKGKDAAPDADDATLKNRFTSDELNQMAVDETWKNFFPSTAGGVWRMGSVGREHPEITPSRYRDDGGGDAANLYRKLLNGMNNFHDKPGSRSYAA